MKFLHYTEAKTRNEATKNFRLRPIHFEFQSNIVINDSKELKDFSNWQEKIYQVSIVEVEKR